MSILEVSEAIHDEAMSCVIKDKYEEAVRNNFKNMLSSFFVVPFAERETITNICNSIFESEPNFEAMEIFLSMDEYRNIIVEFSVPIFIDKQHFKFVVDAMQSKIKLGYIGGMGFTNIIELGGILKKMKKDRLG